jgi:superfamily II DNA or RNA helicase
VFLRANPSRFGVDDRRMEEVLQFLECEDQALSCTVRDSGQALRLLASLPATAAFWEDASGRPLTISFQQQAPPHLYCTWKDQELHLRWEGLETFHREAIWLPGHPGFLWQGQHLQAVRYLGQLRAFVREQTDRLQPRQEPERLLSLMMDKHQVTWLGAKPQLVTSPQIRLELQPSPAGIQGRLTWETPVGWMTIEEDRPGYHFGWTSRNHPVLVHWTNGNQSHVRQECQRHQLPLGPTFSWGLVESEHRLAHQAFPSSWAVERKEADRQMGREDQEVELLWPPGDPLPSYRIGTQVFPHEGLMARLKTEGRPGAVLDDGQFIYFDTEVVRRSHQSLALWQRVLDEPLLRHLPRFLSDTRQEEPILKAYWQTQLRSYQQNGVQWLLDRLVMDAPVLLADEMGLGKTIQVLAALDHLQAEAPHLLVLPRSLLGNWQKEIERFCPSRRVVLYHGKGRKAALASSQPGDLVLTTYGTVRQDLEVLYDIAFDTIILDEAQAVKNDKSQTAEAVRELWGRRRLVMTGTPIENHLGELLSLLQFLLPGLVPEDIPERLVPVISRPFLLRRTKQEVLPDLPPKQEIVVRLTPSPRQAALYEQLRKDAWQELEQRRGSMTSVLTKLLRLRQICCHPGLVFQGEPEESGSKFPWLLDALHLHREAGEAVLVFSQFTTLLEKLRYELEEASFDVLVLDGKTIHRQALVDRFQDGWGEVFLISLKAGGTGLNLTRAATVYHLDPWWNPMVEQQATDRVHRMGQKNAVFSYKLIIEGTVEERILSLQEEKSLKARQLWDENGQWQEQRMSLEDIRGLLTL